MPVEAEIHQVSLATSDLLQDLTVDPIAHTGFGVIATATYTSQTVENWTLDIQSLFSLG
jgi:hypothetical protein